MKKILTLLLAFALVFSLAACGPDDDAVDTAEQIRAINAAIDAGCDVAHIEIRTVISGLVLSGGADITYNADGSSTIDYHYEKLNASAVHDADFKSTVEGTVTCAADGTFSDGGAFLGGGTALKGLDINLPEDMECSINDNGTILVATVAAADAESVLGIAVDADVSVMITLNASGAVSTASVEYVTADGASVQIICNYTHTPDAQ